VIAFRSVICAVALAGAAGLAGSGAVAAPQVLGLVASNGAPTVLDCSGAECTAHFSAFCLQQNRPSPSHGDPYVVAPGGRLTLVATTRSGATLRLPGEKYVEIRSEIGFTSVNITLAKAKLAELGAATVAVEVGPSVSLLPVATAGDPSPQSDDEIALATGAMRQAASRRFEQPGLASDAARITAVMINALPRHEEPAALRNGLWVAMAGNPAVTGATTDGRAAAQQIYEACKISVESRSTFSMRNCLELRQADLLAETNHQFWKDNAGY
jgi:hypothetical protein